MLSSLKIHIHSRTRWLRFLCLILTLTVATAAPLSGFSRNVYAEKSKDKKSDAALPITAKAAVLIENSSGRILYEKNKDKEVIPASITKIMT